MGRIFTWQEVADNAIPKLQSFAKIMELTACQFNRTKVIEEALWFGSALFNHNTVRSDLDCLVIYDHFYQGAFWQLLSKLKVVADELYVPLEFVSFSDAVVSKHLHTIGPSFAHHLGRAVASNGQIKSSCQDLFAFLLPHRDVRQEIVTYIQRKLAFLEKVAVDKIPPSHPEYYTRLRKLTEMPVRVARKVVQYHLSQWEHKDDSASAVVADWKEADNTLGYELEGFVRKDEAYTSYLLKGPSCSKEYAMFLENLYGDFHPSHLHSFLSIMTQYL